MPSATSSVTTTNTKSRWRSSRGLAGRRVPVPVVRGPAAARRCCGARGASRRNASVLRERRPGPRAAAGPLRNRSARPRRGSALRTPRRCVRCSAYCSASRPVGRSASARGGGRPGVAEALRLAGRDLLEPQRQLERAGPLLGVLGQAGPDSGASASGTPCSCGSSCTTRYSITSELPCPKGESAVAAYASVAPSAKTSVAGVTAAPRTCSGARKPGEPTAVPTWVSVVAPVAQAMPKSMIRGPLGTAGCSTA